MAARARALLTGYGADPTLRGEAVDLLVESQGVAAANARRLMRERGEDAHLRWTASGGERRLETDRAWLSEQPEPYLPSSPDEGNGKLGAMGRCR